jgi:hypothetical protein
MPLNLPPYLWWMLLRRCIAGTPCEFLAHLDINVATAQHLRLNRQHMMMSTAATAEPAA